MNAHMRGTAVELMVSSVANPASVPPALLQTPGFFRVSQLVPGDQDVLTIPVGTKVEQALGLMGAHNFDQVPVTTAENRVIGTFTHRSLARGLRHIRPQDNLLSTPVDDLVEELQFVRISQEVSSRH